MTDLVWENPPGKRGPSSLAELVDQLKGRPGEWALVREGTRGHCHSHATHLKKRWGCEATERMLPDGTVRLYARWPA